MGKVKIAFADIDGIPPEVLRAFSTRRAEIEERMAVRGQHSPQAAMIAAQCQTGAYLGRYVVVVDDDIDVYDMNDVLWAMCTRVDPQADTDFIRRAWSGPLDPIIPKDQKGFSSRAIIDATK